MVKHLSLTLLTAVFIFSHASQSLAARRSNGGAPDVSQAHANPDPKTRMGNDGLEEILDYDLKRQIMEVVQTAIHTAEFMDCEKAASNTFDNTHGDYYQLIPKGGSAFYSFEYDADLYGGNPQVFRQLGGQPSIVLRGQEAHYSAQTLRDYEARFTTDASGTRIVGIDFQWGSKGKVNLGTLAQPDIQERYIFANSFSCHAR